MSANQTFGREDSRSIFDFGQAVRIGVLMAILIAVAETIARVLAPALVPGMSQALLAATQVIVVAVVVASGMVLFWRRSRKIDDDRRSEREISALFAANCEDLFILADVHGNVLWLSPSYARFTGWTVEDRQTSDWQSRVHEDDLEKVIATRARNLAGESTRVQYRCRIKNGDYRWLDLQCVPRRDANGKVMHLVTCGRDVTELVTLERRLHEQIERTELATRAGNIGIWEWDIRDQRLVWSERMYPMYDVHPETPVTYETWRERVVLEDLERTEPLLQAAARGEREFITDFRIRRQNGEIRTIAASATVVRDHAGNAERIIGINTDITEVRLQQTRLAASETTLSALVEHAPVAIAILDRERRFLFVSRRWRAENGLLEAEIIGRAFDEFCPKPSPSIRAMHEHCISGGVSSVEDTKSLASDGSEAWVRSHLRPWRDARGHICGIVLFTETIEQTGHVHRAT